MSKPRPANTTRDRARQTLIWACAGILGACAGLACRPEAPASSDTRTQPKPARATQQAPAKQTATDPKTQPPNVLIFLIDTLRADRLGVYGYDKPTSPNMDALAAEGVVFEQCNAPAPWTLPSVVSLLTSTFPCEHDVLVDRQKVDPSWHPLAVRMKVAGYTTATLFSNGYVGRMSGLDRGYDFARSAGYTDGPVVEGLLDKVPAGPLYLYVHNIEPHNPYEAADWIVQRFGATTPQIKNQVQSAYLRFRKLSKADWEQNRPRGSTDNTTEQTQQIQALQELKDKIDVLYDAAVWQADERLGSVIDVFKSRGLWDNTLMIVVADHGEELGDHGGWQHDQSVYEELMHVPLIVRFPQGRFAGRRVSQAVSLVDVMPTIFDVLGKPALAQGCRGTSLMPLIEGQAQRNPDDMVITGMRINRKKYYRPDKDARGDFNVVVRQGRFKGIWNVDLETLELYDLDADPLEQTNLAGVNIEQAVAMEQHVRDWLGKCQSDTSSVPPLDLDSLDEETIESLRALGYIE